jgi:regulator of protease activity HflC (stomatin/prohibitin superfamily)
MISIILGALIILPLFLFKGIHQVEEGHVGIYFRGGAILDGFEEPGWHAMFPFVTTVENV